MAEIENKLTGKKATIMHDRVSHRTLIMKSESTPTEAMEKVKAEKIKKPKTEGAKIEKVEKKAKPELKEIEQKVLDFLKTLDHPATSNEVRDKFGFPLRANARRIFRKLDKLGYGENRRVGKRYLFHVKGKVYPPPPKAESPKAESKKSGQNT